MSHNLGASDIVVFIAYTLLLLLVGLYFTKRQKSLKTFLVANQNVHWTIVGISVLAALFSGITYLGAPAESFFFDLTYVWSIASLFIATPIATLIFLPLFRESKVYTAYEYLERRFDRRLRYLASGMFIVRVTLYLAIAIYAPSLAIVDVTGWPFWFAVLLTGICATVYTSLGGMQAVIWTDTIQFIVLCGGIVVIMLVAASKIPGGILAAWHTAAADGKTAFFHVNPDPRVRMTVWGCLLGGASNALVQLVTDQISVQRYLTAPTLKDSQRALWFKLLIMFPLIAVFYLTGTILYAYYRVTPSSVPLLEHANLVPHLAQPAVGSMTPLPNDRILPYFVIHSLPSPLRGLLVAAIFGATIAVVSAGIHSLATAALMDFARRDNQHDAMPSLLSVRLFIVVFGLAASTLALFVIPYLGTIIQAVSTTFGLFGGPLLGIFLLGALCRRANGSGALTGAIFGAAAGAAIAFSRRLFSVEISFMWISFVSAVVTYLIGQLASRFFKQTPVVNH